MRARLLAGAGALVAALALAGRWTGPAAAPPDPRLEPAPTAVPSGEPASPGGDEVSRPLRDPFHYADQPEPPAAPAAPRFTPEPAPTAAPEAPVRLVGLVRRRGGTRAAVAIAGEVVLLGPGDTAQGWTLVALDEDGARLRGPDGREEVVFIELGGPRE